MAVQRCVLVGLLAIRSVHAGFWDVFSDQEGGLVEAPSARMLETLSRQGERALQRLQGRSEGNECFLMAYLQAQVDCATVEKEGLTKKRLALALAECHLADTSFPVTDTCAWEDDVIDCISRLDSTQVQVYTEFFTHADALCFFLQSEAWQNQADVVSSLMMEASVEVAARLLDMNGTVDELGRTLVTRVQEAEEELQDVAATLGASIDAGNEKVVSSLEGVQSKLDSGLRALGDHLREQVSDMKGGLAELSSDFEGMLVRLDETLLNAYGRLEMAVVNRMGKLDHSFSQRIQATEARVDEAKAAVSGVAVTLEETRVAAEEERQSAAEERRRHAEERSLVLKSIGELHRIVEATTAGWVKLQTIGFLVLSCFFSWLFTSAAPFRFVRPYLFLLFISIAALEWFVDDLRERGHDSCRGLRQGGGNNTLCQVYAMLHLSLFDRGLLRRAGGHVAAMMILLSLFRWLRLSLKSFAPSQPASNMQAVQPAAAGPVPSDLTGLMLQVYALGQEQGRLGVELQIALEELRSSGWSYSGDCNVDGCDCEAWNAEPASDSTEEVSSCAREVSDTCVRIKQEEEDDDDEDEIFAYEPSELQ